MSLRPGMRVLDVGCGVGGPACEIARFSDTTIIGLNNNDFWIQRARKHQFTVWRLRVVHDRRVAAWNSSIPAHKEFAHAIELGNGIPKMRHMKNEAMVNAGFTVEHGEDLAERPDVMKSHGIAHLKRMSWSGKLVSHTIKFMEMLNLLPKGTYDVGESLKVAADAIVKGGQTNSSRPCTSQSAASPRSLPMLD
ncbi:uncharacterized protein EDB93DRAFT_1249052 [Suillus bovinus]|uniref:uncharacterized protein n=1 Tax=Suillus bovinus TaxID=48563 RepID=UPI001B87A385|nr:uncharacterized protein EDB93DRAFT_1249052 [Suillus bovinus]KAG2152532.1 hypothetical protein EDB93DRAFT_1249052 [Suillus bovinus]